MQIPPTCTLDDSGRREQQARYARLSQAVTGVRREPEALVIEFGQELELDVLENALAVERECCPFFRFAFDRGKRRLRTTVADAASLPALDAIAAGFGAS